MKKLNRMINKKAIKKQIKTTEDQGKQQVEAL